MPKIRITKGCNFRLPAYDTPEGMAVLMQNYDMSHEEIIEQIKGSVKYHGANIGTNAPTAVTVNYNEAAAKQDVLVAVDDKIRRKNLGSNEFEIMIEGLTPNTIKNSLNVVNKTYFAHPADGLFEYDGAATIKKVNDIKLRDIIIARETNRCFGITNSDGLAWTDDLADTGGVPIRWPAANIATIPPVQGDIQEKLMMFNGRLLILKTNSIWIYYIIGSASNWRLEKLSFEGGCIAPQTVWLVGGEIWFFGYSPAIGRGLFAIDQSFTVRLLSYDAEPILDRINPAKIKDACAVHVDNLYKFSFALDSDIENNHTLHFDAINTNKDTGMPNFYGAHTYGFSAATVLNTRQFLGEMLFARKHTDGARIFKAADYRTQYSDELKDNGSLIPTVLLSGILSKEGRFGEYDETWFKRYSNLYVENPPKGSWYGTIEILKGFENDTFESYKHYMEGENIPIEAINLDSDSIDQAQLSYKQHAMSFVSDSIQIKISNYTGNTKTAFRSISYDAVPDRRKRHVQSMEI